MKAHSHGPSLLPYLDSKDSIFHLHVPLVIDDPSLLQSIPFPFLLITDSDPLTRLVEAQFRTDSGSVLKKVFLLIQRDNYHIFGNQLSPITNATIEDSWRETFSRHSANTRDQSSITLSQQIDKANGPAQLRPLFFCKNKRTFFEPPCPVCGELLEQCCDDAILSRSGLQKYSTSTNRYLFCRSCFSPGSSADFYAYEKSSFDPPSVKDRVALISEFGRLVQSGTHALQMPCIECSQNGVCHGPEKPAASPIVPFSFYPFFLLIFESMPMSACDFLTLLSGASFDDLEAQLREKGELGRIRHLKTLHYEQRSASPFLFHDEDRFFLEVFYLKLCFLGQVFAAFLLEPTGPRLAGRLPSLEETWVNLEDRSGLLPSFWNFELKFMDMPKNPLEFPTHPKLPPQLSLHFLGLLWFQALLVNSKQNAARVNGAIENAYGRVLPDVGDQPDNPAKECLDPAFKPENIFWVPGARAVSPDWRDLWEESLNLGWSLLRAGLQARADWSREGFQRRMEELRTEVRRRLFPDKALSVPNDGSLEDAAIGGILKAIRSKWEEEPSEPSYQEDVSEKMVVKPPGIFEEETLPLEFTLKKEEEAIPETLILSPPEALEPQPTAALELEPAPAERATQTPSSHDTEDLEITLRMLSPMKEKIEEEKAEDKEALPETLIISPSKDRRVAVPPTTGEPSRRPADEDEREGPRAFEAAEGEKPASTPGHPPEDDLLMETIILTPKKTKSGERDKDEEKKGSHG